MNMKRRIFTFSLMILMCISSSMTAFAVSNISIRALTTESTDSSIRVDLASKTSGSVNLKKESSKRGVSFSTSDYTNTKAVAEKKASGVITTYGSTSVQYALIDNGKIVLSGNSGVYSKENTTALTADSMYGIGSISKMFVTTAVMKLVDDGKIKLDTPITEYIKDFKMADDRYKKITSRMLLNHSSGLMGSSFSNAFLFGDNDTYAHDTFLEGLKTQRLKAEPGAYSVYCNDGFTLAQILVEHVKGIDYTTYVTNTFTSPLKMEDTKTPVSKFDRAKLAKTYYKGISNDLPVENVNAIGAGGIYSSAEDLCAFATTFTKNSNGILSQESIKAMENKEYLNGIWPEDTNNILGYGLGWDSVNIYPFNQYNIKALTKGGDSILYHGNLTVLPEQNMAVAVISSSGSSIYDQVMAQEILLAALKEKGVISEIKPDKTLAIPEKITVPIDMKKYEGLYASASGFINIKIDKTGILSLSFPQIPKYGSQTLVYTKDGTFVSSEGSASIKFVEETNGKIYIKQTSYQNLPLLGQTISSLYIAQKENVNKLTESVSQAWARRDGRKYFLLNEKHSSLVYMLACPKVEISFTKGFEGYFGLNKIVDNNSAVAILDGPGVLSRDLVDYTFYKKDKIEYLSAGGGIYVEEDAIETFPTKNKFKFKIKKDGYARWYKIGAESVDKEITVDIPKNAAFAVYDSNGVLVNDSLITGIKKVKLPKNGTIVFLGDAQAKFKIQYKE